MQNASVLGPAKTLKLRKIESPSEYKDIYKALSHYETMVTGDILVVQNNVPEYAYFGELNANLAIRQGVRAVVIGGKLEITVPYFNKSACIFNRVYLSRCASVQFLMR